jgi:hypothetical protein
MITYKIHIGDDVVYDIFLNVSNPLSVCEIYKGNQLITFGTALCKPNDEYSQQVGAEKSLKSAINRINLKTGEAFIHPRFHERFFRWIPKACYRNTVVKPDQIDLINQKYVEFLKTIYGKHYQDEE